MKIVITVVIVLVVLALVAAALSAVARKRRHEQRVVQADALRQHADGEQHRRVEEERAEARAVEAEAERKAAEADKAAIRAQDAQQGLAREEALREDEVRSADRIDPDVKHRRDDYRPEA